MRKPTALLPSSPHDIDRYTHTRTRTHITQKDAHSDRRTHTRTHTYTHAHI
ncbi:hypothetical protein WUBG_10487 [Wuchereria bancrofti]|uniref:Uncharacterized protein n=1 Tax=Wuchereria bancrofti TaxID=6293 RepID=J9ETQ0_WUCBA|nr:hypothetical protein WUBG_10487 [Wuchereria bancrofti]